MKEILTFIVLCGWALFCLALLVALVAAVGCTFIIAIVIMVKFGIHIYAFI